MFFRIMRFLRIETKAHKKTRRQQSGKFMRRTVRYSLIGRRRNEDILEELKVDTVENKLTQYKQKIVK